MDKDFSATYESEEFHKMKKEFNLSEEIEKLKEKVEHWRDHFYHEADGFEEDADEMMNELLDEIDKLEQANKEFIKRLKVYFYHPRERKFIDKLAGKELSK